jgi:hypothetical protein
MQSNQRQIYKLCFFIESDLTTSDFGSRHVQSSRLTIQAVERLFQARHGTKKVHISRQNFLSVKRVKIKFSRQNFLNGKNSCFYD